MVGDKERSSDEGEKQRRLCHMSQIALPLQIFNSKAAAVIDKLKCRLTKIAGGEGNSSTFVDLTHVGEKK
jgi:hypothetical protein